MWSTNEERQLSRSKSASKSKSHTESQTFTNNHVPSEWLTIGEPNGIYPDILNGMNIFSPVSGCIMACLVFWAAHSSESVIFDGSWPLSYSSSSFTEASSAAWNITSHCCLCTCKCRCRLLRYWVQNVCLCNRIWYLSMLGNGNNIRSSNSTSYILFFDNTLRISSTWTTQHWVFWGQELIV